MFHLFGFCELQHFHVNKKHHAAIRELIGKNETTDVTHEELYDALSRIAAITGTLEIVNTNYTNLSFLVSLFVIFSVREERFGYDLIIVNNSKLENMANGALLTSSANIRIEDNPLLDPNCSHVLQYYSHHRRIRGNRFNCGCELEVALTDKNINNVEDYCDAVFGSLYLFGPNVPQPEILTKKFGRAKFVIGEIAIVSTNYTNFSFLQSVSRIELFYNRFGESIDLSSILFERLLPKSVVLAPNALERYV
ncbi:hypothetical protein OESDEN_11190 [Oesophagostomum dentatum]|uniref:Receptor L-domain domain-containing protein n=1 Tax=Oesophagostomum dentatum TaxID=61180 RepID=A0A0B1T0P6_OESDE|nr:hypothetical protein OESDEN_11190 [Oesophagostomum dentatum]